jgi:hypothetical protein
MLREFTVYEITKVSYDVVAVVEVEVAGIGANI